MQFTSTPKGAAVLIDGKKRGKTPVKLQLPCRRATAVFERTRYGDEKKTFEPRRGKTTKVSARLERPSFTVRIDSSPAGASVAVRGKTVGKTPLTTKVRGFQATTIKISKPGYQTRTTKVTATKNGTAVKVTLPRGN